MDPVGSGWPYAYNRLVAATAASGSASGNFSAAANHQQLGSVTATPLLVQPTATVPTTVVNPYGTSSFLAPPTVGYDVFSTLFHPHAAAAAQVSSQAAAAANIKTLNYATGSGLLNSSVHQLQETSNSSTNSSSSSPSATHQQQGGQQQQYNYQSASTISRSNSNATWNSGNAGGQGQQTHGQQQQFSGNSSLATITRVNSNGCAGGSGGGTAAAVASTTSAMYDTYNAQLKAHSLYQLNSHLANAAVMAMANKLSANRNSSLSVQQLASSSVTNSHSPTPNANQSAGTNNGNSSYALSTNDRIKIHHHQQLQQQDYGTQSTKTSHAAAAIISSPSPSSSNSSPAIPLIQFEAAKLQQQLQTQAKALAQQQQQHQHQQPSPVSYSMWSNSSPVQNKFSCDVVQQEVQHNERRPMAAFTRQPQQQQSAPQRATESESQYRASTATDQGSGTNSQAAVVVVPRRPSPMQMSQSSPAYPMYNSPMNMTNQQQQYSNNNSTSSEVTYQETHRNEPPSLGYSSVITRVAGSAWEQVGQNQNQQQQQLGDETATRTNRAPKKRRPTTDNNSWPHQQQNAISQQSQQPQSNRAQPVKQPHVSPSAATNSSAYNATTPNNTCSSRSALPSHSPAQGQVTSAVGPVPSQSREYGQQRAVRQPEQTEEEEAEMDRRRAELARSQVVVPDIMEELNFLTADGIRASKKASPTKQSNGRVQIISVEAAGEEKKTQPTVVAKKPEDKGFIGSYLKFLQGEPSQPSSVGSPGAARGKRVGGGGTNRNTEANKRRAALQQQQDEEEEAVKRSRLEAKDDQGYVPNGGASAFELNYQQQQQQAYPQPFVHPLNIPGTHHGHYQGLQMAGSEAAGGSLVPVAGAVPTNQILAQSSYPAVTEADGFNYFDLQFRPRW